MSLRPWLRAFVLGGVLLSAAIGAPGEPGGARAIRVGGRVSVSRFVGAQSVAFQSSHAPYACDQIFSGRVGLEPELVSTGTGRASGPSVVPAGPLRGSIVFASTHLSSPACPPSPSPSRGYVWSLGEAELFVASPGGEYVRLTDSPGFDGEAAVSPDGRRIAFTSARDGDLEIYVMNVDGTGLRRLTNEPGYDGQPAFSPDGSLIAFVGHDSKTRRDRDRSRELLAEGLVDPSHLEIFVMGADGESPRRITRDGGANFAPTFHPDGRHVLFSSNKADPRGRNFDLYLVAVDGTGEERLTSEPAFEAYPQLRADGSEILFVSNRDGSEPGELNLYVAEWPLR